MLQPNGRPRRHPSHPRSRLSTVIVSAASLLLLLSVPGAADAASRYIRAGASGNGSGSDWTNALTSFPTSTSGYVRGDTYYVADGTYTQTVDLRVPESGNTTITIKKATAQDHGTNTGWSASYGDGVAEIVGSIQIDTDYWIIDGVTGQGRTGYGIKVRTTACSSASKLVQVNNGADFITVSHVEMQHCGIDIGYNQDCVYAVSSADGGSSNLTVSHSYMHDVSRVMMLLNNVRNSVIEHNFFERRRHTSIHGEAISMNYCGTNANNTFRWNTFKDIHGTGVLVIKDSVQSHMYIHGNLFYQTSDNFETHNAAISNTGGDTNTHMYVYNNTFANFSGSGNSGTGILWYNGSNNYAYNNLWYNCRNINLSGTTHDYNAFQGTNNYGEAHAQTGLTSAIFADYARDDFRLAQHTAAGKADIGSQYALDMNGNVRGSGGCWCRGAFQLGTGGVTPPEPPVDEEPPSPPAGLRIITP